MRYRRLTGLVAAFAVAVGSTPANGQSIPKRYVSGKLMPLITVLRHSVEAPGASSIEACMGQAQSTVGPGETVTTRNARGLWIEFRHPTLFGSTMIRCTPRGMIVVRAAHPAASPTRPNINAHFEPITDKAECKRRAVSAATKLKRFDFILQTTYPNVGWDPGALVIEDQKERIAVVVFCTDTGEAVFAGVGQGALIAARTEVLEAWKKAS